MFKVILNNKPTKAACAAVARTNVVRRALPVEQNGFVLTGYDEGAPDPKFPYLVVLDFDKTPDPVVFHVDYTAHLRNFETYMVETGSGGFHLYFWTDENIGNSQKLPLTQWGKENRLKGFDVRGKGGIIFAPGCKFTDHKKKYKEDYYSQEEHLPVRKIKAAKIHNLIRQYTWIPTDPYKRMREGFRTIMNGDWDLTHDMNKTTGIDEWLYWSAFWREYLNCGGTIKDGVVHFTTTGLQRTFDEEETVRQLETAFFQKLGDKRPSNDFYFRLFPDLEDELKMSTGPIGSSDISERVKTLEDGFHELNNLFQELCKTMPKRRY